MSYVRDQEIAEMAEMLAAAGFAPGAARILYDEGMGPYELEARLAMRPGEVGSLEYTHRMRRGTRRNPLTTAEKVGLGVAGGVVFGPAIAGLLIGGTILLLLGGLYAVERLSGDDPKLP